MPLLPCQYEAVLEGLFESAVEAAHDALEPGRLEQPGQDDHVGEQAADALDAPRVVGALLVRGHGAVVLQLAVGLAQLARLCLVGVAQALEVVEAVGREPVDVPVHLEEGLDADLLGPLACDEDEDRVGPEALDVGGAYPLRARLALHRQGRHEVLGHADEAGVAEEKGASSISPGVDCLLERDIVLEVGELGGLWLVVSHAWLFCALESNI